MRDRDKRRECYESRWSNVGRTVVGGGNRTELSRGQINLLHVTHNVVRMQRSDACCRSWLSHASAVDRSIIVMTSALHAHLLHNKVIYLLSSKDRCLQAQKMRSTSSPFREIYVDINEMLRAKTQWPYLGMSNGRMWKRSFLSNFVEIFQNFTQIISVFVRKILC